MMKKLILVVVIMCLVGALVSAQTVSTWPGKSWDEMTLAGKVLRVGFFVAWNVTQLVLLGMAIRDTGPGA